VFGQVGIAWSPAIGNPGDCGRPYARDWVRWTGLAGENDEAAQGFGLSQQSSYPIRSRLSMEKNSSAMPRRESSPRRCKCAARASRLETRRRRCALPDSHRARALELAGEDPQAWPADESEKRGRHFSRPLESEAIGRTMSGAEPVLLCQAARRFSSPIRVYDFQSAPASSAVAAAAARIGSSQRGPRRREGLTDTRPRSAR